MELENKNTSPEQTVAMTPAAQPIGPEQVKKFTQVLQKYKSGKSCTEARIKASEEWWKLRNSGEEAKQTEVGTDGGYDSKSGWLHNVIVNKHADAMEAYPEPNILPREVGDRAEARRLSAIVPFVLEQNHFEDTYSQVNWQKFKTGTGVYKVVWDKNKLGGLGDIAVERVSLLNIYWEPGFTDIQRSRYFFHVELRDKELLRERYPQLRDRLKSSTIINTEFRGDDPVDESDKASVIEVYYHKYVSGRKILHYCKYVEDVVLYATENDPALSKRGLYDHGRYPYEFDPLFPIEGSPCGYGYVDVCKSPQLAIDALDTSFLKSARVGAIPRFLSRTDGNINEEELLDVSRPVVHVNGSVDEASMRQISFDPLDSVYVGVYDRKIQELRETSGNTETGTGNVSSGVTAASAIAALQEASGKGSRDSTRSAYRAYTRVVELCIELIRQFYDMPRQFRIRGQYGADEFITYTNKDLKPQHQGDAFGNDMGYRLPVFDITVSAQKKNIYTKVTQNELALQFFQLGFFNHQMTDQALMCLDLMEFDGKDTVMQKVAQQGTMFQKLVQYMQLALTFAQAVRPDMVQGISQDIMKTMGVQAAAAPAAGAPKMMESDNIAGIQRQEPAIVQKARSRAGNASQPGAGQVKKEETK